MKLTKADKAAVQSGDSSYLLNKGIRYFYDQDYEFALEYFHLSAALGNGRANGYLGYCYMYGKGVPVESDIALSYFHIALDSRDIDACYKLGTIYCNGDGVEQDVELGQYYYQNALAELLDNNPIQERFRYPELFLALAIEKKSTGVDADLSTSYKYLLIAQTGFTLAVSGGAYYFEEKLEEVEKRLVDPIYKEISEVVRKEYEEEYLS